MKEFVYVIYNCDSFVVYDVFEESAEICREKWKHYLSLFPTAPIRWTKVKISSAVQLFLFNQRYNLI